MGLGTGGSIKLHYEALSKAVVQYLKWTTYQQLKAECANPQAMIFMLREQDLFPDGHLDEAPEVYQLYKKCEKWGNWWEGGLADQPSFLYSEFLVCEGAEAEFQLKELPGLRKLVDANQLQLQGQTVIGPLRS